MMTDAKKISGYLARSSVSRASRLIREIQRDLVGVISAAIQGDTKRLEGLLVAVMEKLQECHRLLDAAMTGNYEEVQKKEQE